MLLRFIVEGTYRGVIGRWGLEVVHYHRLPGILSLGLRGKRRVVSCSDAFKITFDFRYLYVMLSLNTSSILSRNTVLVITCK